MIVDRNASHGAEPSWRKSSYRSGGGVCVEVVTAPGTVHVRDSKKQTDTALAFPKTSSGPRSLPTWVAAV
jgi:hypothetical protein